MPTGERAMDRLTLALLSAGHFSVDLSQGAVPALLPYFVAERGLSYAAAAGLVLAQTVSSSVLQPLFGQLTDRWPAPWLLPAGVAVAGAGLGAAALLPTYGLIWLAIAVSGIGVAAYHPEGARYARYASGSRRATGMSFFSVGGNAGFAAGPVLATPILLLLGLHGGWAIGAVPIAVAVALAAALGRIEAGAAAETSTAAPARAAPGPDRWGPFFRLTGVLLARSVLFYGLNTFIPLYWIGVFHQGPGAAGAALATLLVAGAFGTLLGGRLADRFSRRSVIVVAVALTVPLLVLFVAMPTPLAANAVLVPLALAMYVPSSILVVMGQEYLPGRVGTASGVTLGLAVSVGGVVTPALGFMADQTGLRSAMGWLVLVPLVAMPLALSLPRERRRAPAGPPD
ncbi:MAG TPA: MFS transporter [Candidatus Dormibacteraeota bacterium]|nr:MFS transporter [Candidatus Dormibacteraeota bacterium]